MSLLTYFIKARVLLFETLPQLETCLGFFSTTAALFYEKIVIWPVERLYRHGPSLFGFGFWRGTEPADICAAITGVPAKHWIVNDAECARRIDADIRSYVVLLETCIYFFCIYSALKALAFYASLLFHSVLHRRGWIDRYSPRLMGWVRHKLPAPANVSFSPDEKNYMSAAKSNSNRRHTRAFTSALEAAKLAEKCSSENSTGKKDSSPYEVYAPKN